LAFVPLKHWKKSWAVGIVAMVVVFSLDNTMEHLGAFKFWYGGIYVYGLPLFYWLCYFPGGIMFDYLRPHKHIWRLAYILIIAAVYLMIELVMVYSGYFQYVRWNAFMSYLLNVVGFTITMWYAEWLEEGRNK
jgi:surface polysaccharide O-acyltransferase-like enzyme